MEVIHDENAVGLRDMFAMVTLLAILPKIISSKIYDQDDVAVECYDMADAMMEERKERKV